MFGTIANTSYRILLSCISMMYSICRDITSGAAANSSDDDDSGSDGDDSGSDGN